MATSLFLLRNECCMPLNKILKIKFPVLIIFLLHFVGILGIIWGETRPLMIILTPAHLLISGILLIYGHQKRDIKFIAFVIISALIGFISEVIGTNTGLIFGDYSYGNALGFQIWNTPIIIGINWFILSYCIGHMINYFKTKWWIKSIIGALLMTLIDVMIEPVAILLTYWKWENHDIPLSNYFGWFGISLIIQLFYFKLHVNAKNQTAIPLLASQLAFFLVLLLFISSQTI
jgi:uncharacterized membrane protein